jgi:class 3 adenylate cyclase
VLCSNCGTYNPPTAKFCIGCASPLPRKCTSCGAENLVRAKFCSECAAPLIPLSSSLDQSELPIATNELGRAATADGERKTVTALFADIKGSMELMEDLDPEDARAIIDPALKLMIDVVHRYDGYIVQSTGDGIFALFGAPLAHEDHPQRALYAALRLQEEMHRYAGRLREAGNLPIEARVGVNTGEAVVRSLATREGHVEYTPIGHSTGLAARMQALAPTGSIATTDATRKPCEGYFTFKALGPTRVRGVSEPISVFEVTGLGPLRTHFQVSARRGLTKFVGRQREIEALQHALELAEAGHGQIVATIAEPGVGKSRLFFEFKAVSKSECMVLETFSVSHGQASAYLPVIELLHGYFGIEPGDNGRKRCEKVAGKITMLDRALEDTLPYLFSLLAIVEGDDPLVQMDGQVKRRRTLEAIKRILLRESVNQPLMVIFEDLHWIDEQTQQFLNLLADSIGTARILLLVNYRPEYAHQWNSKTYYTQLRLDPLGHDSAEEMLTSLLGEDDDLAPLRRLIIEKTEGTPFFMEEIVQALFEDGAVVRNGSVKLTRPLAQIGVPATVQAVLASRIDRLRFEEKELLHTLAVLGREFPLALVERMRPKPNDELESMLARLQAAEFIYEQPATGDMRYTFKHALTQEVAYNSVLIERRKLVHELAARAMEEVYHSKLDDHYAQLAHHYRRSGNAHKALQYLQLAGEQAVQRSAHTEAVGHLTAALELAQTHVDIPERTHQELVVHTVLAPVLMAVKGYAAPELKTICGRARELCRQTGEAPQLVRLLRILVAFYVTGQCRVLPDASSSR